MTDGRTTPPHDPTPSPPGPDHPEGELVAADDAVIGRAFRWSLLVIVLIAIVVAIVVWPRGADDEDGVVIDRPPVEAPAALQRDARAPEVVFIDITSGAGVSFVHESGATGEKLLPESMGSGVAFIDYDGDGDQDLLFVNATTWDRVDAETGPLARGTGGATPSLYRNDGTGRFDDVTAAVGLDVSFYGVGVAAADYDGDGDVDLYFTALGPNRLFRNDDGAFVEITLEAGVAGGADAWSTSAGFFDADGDGDLDLFTCNYVRWSRALDIELNFTLNGTDRAYGPPKLYAGDHCTMHRNDGDGTFTDVSAAAGLEVVNPATGAPMGKALGVVFVDADVDGDLDVIVANDTVQNFVFENDGAGVFTEVGAASNLAFDAMGSATGAMGMDAADYRNDGALAVAIGNFANETTSFYVQQPRDPWQFADMSGSEGIASPSRVRLSFGLFFFDYDLDGRLDLLQSNGHLETEINEIQPSQHYRQPAQLFWNRGSGARTRFALVPDGTVGDLATPIVGRGAAYGDIDGDGDLDVALTQTGGRAVVLRNDQALGHHHLRVKLVGPAGNRDAIGARLELRAGGSTQRRAVMPTRSYCSQVELPVTFGLGGTTSIESLRVVWPDGREALVDAVDVDRPLVLTHPDA